MELLIPWLVFSVAVGIWASNRGRSGIGWFLLAFMLSPLLAAIILAASRDLSRPMVAHDLPAPSTHVTCPDCAEFVRNEARVCKHCGCKLIPTAPEPTRTVGDAGLTGRQIAGIIVALIVAYVIFRGA